MFTYEKHQVQTHAKIKEVVSIFFNLGKKKKKKIAATDKFGLMPFSVTTFINHLKPRLFN